MKNRECPHCHKKVSIRNDRRDALDEVKKRKDEFSEDEIKLSLKRLLKSNIINQQLLGYNISQEIIENVQLMPKYKL